MHWLWDSLVDMEVVALAGLVSLGYAVSRLAGPPTKKQEGFQGGGDPNGYGMTFKPNSQTVALKSSPRSALAQTPQGASAVAPAPDLDLF